MAVRSYFLALTAALILLFGFMLGHRPLSTPDEGRYAEIPREMVESGDYITPRLNGVKYFEKPPLLYWAEAGLIKIGGLSEFVLRLLPALLGLFGCLWLFFITARLADPPTAWISAGILATTSLYYAHTRLLILDLGVSVFISLTLFSYLMATRSTTSLSQNRWLMGFYGGAALAVLTKGIVGAILPGTIILLWTLPWQRWTFLKLAFKPWGILLFLGITAPWHILVSLENPEFPAFYFIHEHFERFTSKVHGRYQPWWFFIPILALGLFPWLAFLPQAFYNGFKKIERDVFQFLSIWIVFIFIFFSCSYSKLIPYILPIFPPLALILGFYIAPFWQDPKNTLGFVWGVQTFRWICLVLFIGAPIALWQQDMSDLVELYPYLLILGLTLLGAIWGTGYFVERGQVRATLTWIAGSTILIFISLNAAWPILEDRSIKPLALTLQKLKVDSDSVICYERYYQDLPVYLNQKVMVAGWTGELSFGMQHQDTRAWMISQTQFWEHWRNKRPVYVIMRRKTFESLQKENLLTQATVIEQTNLDILIRNF